MKTNHKQVQWLVFWLLGYLPFALMAAAVTNTPGAVPVSAPLSAAAPAAAPAVAPALEPAKSTTSQHFPSTEPEFETLPDAGTIDYGIVTALAQDARGLIWIGTQTGLVRYDGYRFRKFVHQPADPFSLAGNHVYSLSVAKDGRIWVGTNSDGISVFDPASERFEHFRHDEKVKESLSGGRILALANDAEGGMWIATDQGLDYLAHGGKPRARPGARPRRG